jgi:ketosteroid isomerase-like protein
MRFGWYLLYLAGLLSLCACNAVSKKNQVEKSKSEILQTEKAFAEMADKQGIREAFLYYAADDAVLMRNNKLIIGKEVIGESLPDTTNRKLEVKLTWEPDFVDVANSGDLGYTYGRYIYSVTDSLGVIQRDTGIFHTVWKRQEDGRWRFVWD